MYKKKTYSNMNKKKPTATNKQLTKRINQASDVYLTKTKIAVRDVRSDRNGRIVVDETKYFPRNKTNTATANKIMGRMRYGR